MNKSTIMKKKMTKKNKNNYSKNNMIFKYISTYILFIISFSILYFIFNNNLTFLNVITAKILSVILNLLGVSSAHSGQIVSASTFSCNIIDECTGLYEIIVYAACVLAYPTTTNKKMVGIAMGTPILLTVNMLRLLFLTFIGIWYTNLFDFFHYTVWQVTLIIFVAMVFLIWIYEVVKK